MTGQCDVLVVGVRGGTRAVFGELFATEARRRGLAGIVTDGFCRDLRGLREIGLPVFARGTTPRSGTSVSRAELGGALPEADRRDLGAHHAVHDEHRALDNAQRSERIGDEAEKIGYIGSRLAAVERPADRYREIKHLGRLVGDMVHEALDAFARLDPEGAVAIAKKDRLVDEEYEAIQRQCITFMMEDPRTIRRALDVLWVARALERIGDHAKNVCEYVVYMVHGKDIRHLSIDEVERHLQSRAQRGSGPNPEAASR